MKTRVLTYLQKTILIYVDVVKLSEMLHFIVGIKQVL